MRTQIVVLAALIALATAATPQRPSGECISPEILSSARSGAFPGHYQVISSSAAITAPTYTKVVFAQEFDVSYFDSYKVVYNKRANETYVLVPCGVSAPNLDQIPQGAKIFSVPLLASSVSDTSIVAFMAHLGVTSRIVNVTEYAVNSCMQSLGQYGCKRLSLSAKSLRQEDRDAVDSFFGFSKDATNSKSIAVTASADPGVLNRAEWIKFVATFFNKEDVANDLFAITSQNFNSIKAAANAAANADVSKRPLVAWLYYQPGNPDWGIYGREQIQIQFATYMTEYAEAAGGRMMDWKALNATYVDGKDITWEWGSIVLYNMETVGASLTQILKDVDVAVDLSRYPGKANADVTLEDFLQNFRIQVADVQSIKFLRAGAVLRVDVGSNPDGYTDWYEGAVAQPDLVLRDLTAVITPNAVPANAAPRFVRNMLTQRPLVLEAKQCPLPNCRATVQTICPLLYKDCSGKVVYATPAQRCAPDCTAAPAPGTDVGAPNSAASAIAAPVAMIAAVLVAMVAMLMV